MIVHFTFWYLTRWRPVNKSFGMLYTHSPAPNVPNESSFLLVFCVFFFSAPGFGGNHGGIIALREATSGSMPDPGWLARRSFLVQGREKGVPQETSHCQRETLSAIPRSVQPMSDDTRGIERAGKLAAGGADGQQNAFAADQAASEPVPLRAERRTSIESSLHTPTKPAPAKHGSSGELRVGNCAAPATPTTGFTTSTDKV